MATVQRRVEAFMAGCLTGCLTCDETVRLVKLLTCPSCEVQVYDCGKAVR
jgi:hypothetical protein